MMRLGRADLLLGDDHGAVGRAAAHLRAVDRDVGDVQALVHARVGQEVADEHDALAAEAGDDDILVHQQVASSSLEISLNTPRGK